ncbi:MAG TPA: hypothetical protein VM432_03535 [Bdellovibrionales bacterium]|nr:hypothetical protein [Bdellovibrionales bacterium]
MKSLILTSIIFSAGLSSPDAILKSEPIKVRPGAEFVKLSLVFNKNEKISRISVDSCDRPFNDGIDFFFYPGFRSSYAEAGKKTLGVVVPRPNDPVRTVAIMFGNNEDLCLNSIKVWNGAGELLSLSLANGAKASAASIEPSSTEVLRSVIDREYTNKEKTELWRYRFRSDGTFFVRGFADEMNDSREFSALGTYKIVSSSKKKAKFELEGMRYSTPQPWDGLVCTKECGMQEIPGTPVKESVEIEHASGGALFVRNRNDRSSRTLPFSDLKIRASTLRE